MRLATKFVPIVGFVTQEGVDNGPMERRGTNYYRWRKALLSR